ncbi:MAG: enediyne biosynthesis protein [Bryobacterales bacterium]|nr:enediyne biosynthesis protein [Bryobacterales bacterium]
MSRGVLAWLLAAQLASGQIQFGDVTKKAGVNFLLRNGAAGQFRQPELMPGGVAALDFNNDGCADIFFTNGAALPSLRKTGPLYSNRLFRNNCDMTFTDVTERAGVAGEGYSMAVAPGDFDNDGFPDLFVAGVNRNILYRNRGDGTFEDVTAKAALGGIDAKRGKMWSVSAGWLDYDNDGKADLFVSNYVRWDPLREKSCGPPERRLYCHPDNYEGTPNQLFHNNGDGTFTDASVQSGIAAHVGKGMGVSFAYFDGVGFTDVFVANDSVRNFLFRNRGDGTFEEVGLQAGVALADHGNAIAGMGTDFRDYNNDGLPDIIVTGMLNDTYPVFSNHAGTAFFDETIRSGVARVTSQLTGWGMGLFDFDNDGWKDLFFANSHFPQLNRYVGTSSELANSVLRNTGDGRFQDVSATAGAGFGQKALYRGAAFADFDNDGRVDVVVTALNGPAKILRNTTPNAGHWLAIQLEGTKSNRDGLGARVSVTRMDGSKLYNHATTSVGYASGSERLVRFGLAGDVQVKAVEVQWPGGKIQKLENVAADRVLGIKE